MTDLPTITARIREHVEAMEADHAMSEVTGADAEPLYITLRIEDVKALLEAVEGRQ